MKISFSPEQFFDDEGRPLSDGRITFYKHDSDTKARIFTLSGDVYSACENPVTVAGDGRIPTVWFEAAVIDVKVERRLPNGNYELTDTFQAGFDWPSASNATLAYGIAGLMETNPEVGIVQVVGYATNTDCPPRFYVWDEHCTTPADGGAIVESSVGEEGRWVLLYEDEFMPSCFYGIDPGTDESNINAFLSYPETVGSFHIRMPPVPRFMAGTYTSDTSWVTTKAVCFDRGAKFTKADIRCRRAIIPDWADYVCDLSFTEKAEAHSGWFRTVQAWWTCGAKYMFLDDTNHFAVKTLSSVVNLSGVILSGTTRVDTTYANGAYITLAGCTIEGTRIFSATNDLVKFQNTEFRDEWFLYGNAGNWDFGRINLGHRTELETAVSNRIVFDNFRQPDVYLKACLANGDTAFDGHGATYYYLGVNEQFLTLRNLTISGNLIDRKATAYDHVVVDGLTTFELDQGWTRNLAIQDSSIMLYGDTSAIANATIDRSYIRGGGKWCPSTTSLRVTDTEWEAVVELSDTAKTERTHNKAVSFSGCKLNTRDNHFWLNDITMENCSSNTHVYLVPYHDGTNFRINGTFRDNRFSGGALIDCGPKDPSTEPEVYDVMVVLTVQRNHFGQEDSRGVALPYMSSDWAHTFVSLLGSGGTYSNNTGFCPREMQSAMYAAADLTETLDGSPDIHYAPRSAAQRVWNLNPNGYFKNSLGIQFTPRGYTWNEFNGADAKAHEGALIHTGWVAIDSNDQFSVCHAWEDNEAFDSAYYAFLWGLNRGRLYVPQTT